MKLIATLFSAMLIVVADALIKKVSGPVDNPLTLWGMIGVLYAVQCYLAYLVFKTGNAPLGLFACLFVVFYSIMGCLAGWCFFGEALTWMQLVGTVLGLAGAVLIVL